MSPTLEPLPLEDVQARIVEVIDPRHFFVAGALVLEWEHVAAEDVSWEVYQGRLLDASQTRELQTFEAWNIYCRDAAGRSAEPLLSVKLAADQKQVHVVRAILSYAWEGYHAGDNVYLSRETTKWLRELVGTIDLGEIRTSDQLRDALERRIFQAVVGVSRLPLTSVEAPLPAFTLGELGYFPSVESQTEPPMRSPDELIDRALTPRQPWPWKAKLLELVLRTAPTAALADVADAFGKRWATLGHTADQLIALFRTLFDDVALSPYTKFVDTTLAFLDHLERRGHWSPDQRADFLGGLLRQLVRHLTAFDLVTFHHRGANYPDALVLDAALKSYFALAERRPDLFDASALRRRAVRQACLLRCWYEGHPVPDLPTSPGENSRVLPPEFPRVPDEQIADPTKRRKRLFDGDPLLPKLTDFQRDLLRGSLRDLQHPTELRELGIGLFLDRPLGVLKRPGEPDQTPLFSYEAYSATIAQRRLRFLEERLSALADPSDWVDWRHRLAALPVQGLPLQLSSRALRPGVVSLADAFQVAPDFVLIRTTLRSLREILGSAEWGFLIQGSQQGDLNRARLIVSGGAVGNSPQQLQIYDAALQLQREIEIIREQDPIRLIHSQPCVRS